LNENENSKSKSDRKELWDSWGPEALDPAKYPAEAPDYKGAVDEFRSSIVPFAKKVLRSLAVYLKLEDLDFFVNQHQALEDPRIRSQNVIRSNYYMPVAEAAAGAREMEEVMRCTEHKDWGTITFLIQDSVGGLEAKTRAGDWIPVTPIPGSVILNAGLMLEMWSGGHFPAAVSIASQKMSG
jgi:isopenicillin N synthase-like dioxygenase